LVEKVLWCDIKIKVILSILWLELFVNAFVYFCQKGKNLQKKTYTSPNIIAD
jgi:hypothetical protein